MISSNERSTEVHVDSEGFQILLAQAREVVQPEVRVLKFGQQVRGDSHVSEDLTLRPLLGDGELVHSVLFHLFFETVGGSGDGHTGAVEGEREEDVVALDLLVAGGELGLGQGEGVAQMELTVHVWVGEGQHEFLGVFGRIHFVRLVRLP